MTPQMPQTPCTGLASTGSSSGVGVTQAPCHPYIIYLSKRSLCPNGLQQTNTEVDSSFLKGHKAIRCQQASIFNFTRIMEEI